MEKKFPEGQNSASSASLWTLQVSGQSRMTQEVREPVPRIDVPGTQEAVAAGTLGNAHKPWQNLPVARH